MGTSTELGVLTMLLILQISDENNYSVDSPMIFEQGLQVTSSHKITPILYVLPNILATSHMWQLIN